MERQMGSGTQNVYRSPSAAQLKIVQSIVKRGMISGTSVEAIHGPSAFGNSEMIGMKRTSKVGNAKLILAHLNDKYSKSAITRKQADIDDSLSSSLEGSPEIIEGASLDSSFKPALMYLHRVISNESISVKSNDPAGVRSPENPKKGFRGNELPLSVKLEERDGSATPEDIESIVSDISEQLMLSLHITSEDGSSSSVIHGNIRSVSSLPESAIPSEIPNSAKEASLPKPPDEESYSDSFSIGTLLDATATGSTTRNSVKEGFIGNQLKRDSSSTMMMQELVAKPTDGRIEVELDEGLPFDILNIKTAEELFELSNGKVSIEVQNATPSSGVAAEVIQSTPKLVQPVPETGTFSDSASHCSSGSPNSSAVSITLGSVQEQKRGNAAKRRATKKKSTVRSSSSMLKYSLSKKMARLNRDDNCTLPLPTLKAVQLPNFSQQTYPMACVCARADQCSFNATISDLVSYHLSLTQQLIERHHRLYLSQCKAVQLMEKEYQRETTK